MPKPATPPDVGPTLAAAAAVIGAFRAGLHRAGYPFREPADTQAVLRDIDMVLFPEEIKSGKVYCKICHSSSHKQSECGEVSTDPPEALKPEPKFARTPSL